jgi:hypothetical protein
MPQKEKWYEDVSVGRIHVLPYRNWHGNQFMGGAGRKREGV